MESRSSESKDPPSIDWDPARLFDNGSQEPKDNFALLILNQPVENLETFKPLWEKATFRIAADGAGNCLHELFKKNPELNAGLTKPLDVICGDMDSLEEESEAYFGTRGTRTVKIDDQESATDFGKCLVYIKNDIVPKQPGLNVVVLGGLGGRMDHAFSQVHQLFKEHKECFSENYQVGRIYLLSTESIAFVLGPDVIHRIYVKDKHESFVLGKHVGIIPFKGKAMITTKGLKWDVEKWETEIGDDVSTSNIVEGFETSSAIAVCTTLNSVLFTIDLPDKLRNVIQAAGTK